MKGKQQPKSKGGKYVVVEKEKKFEEAGCPYSLYDDRLGVAGSLL